MTLFKSQITQAAHEAATAYYQDKLGGVDNLPHGFVWLKVFPRYKGNTKEGRAERRDLAQLGFSKDYTGKAYELWNPSDMPVQSVDVLFAGAKAAADLMKQHGYRAAPAMRVA